MSWIDIINNGIEIETGDGKTYTPLYSYTGKIYEFNLAQFEFPGVSGSLVKRGQPKATKYEFDITFQGDDHIEEARAFEKSSKDSRPWTLTHPKWGQITVHPVTLRQDESSYNFTKITGQLIETIIEEKPKVSIDPKDKIANDHASVTKKLGDAYDAKPDIKGQNALKNQLNKTNKIANAVAKLNSESQELTNRLRDASRAVDKALSYPQNAIRAIQTLINAPIQFIDSVQNRTNNLKSQFNSLKDQVASLLGIDGNGSNDSESTKYAYKKAFESLAGTSVAAMAYTATLTNNEPEEEDIEDDETLDTVAQGGNVVVNQGVAVAPLGDINQQDGGYVNRQEVLAQAESILDTYNDMMETLDSVQSENGGEPNAYVPEPTSMEALKEMVGFTISNLIQIALESRQERTVVLEADSTAILLTHRFYGLDEDDNNLNYFMRTNDIGLNEYLIIKKGRELVYYV